MKFGLDLDGVLGNFTAEVVRTANSLWPNKIPIGYIPDNWDYQGVLNSEEWKQVWTALIDTENLWLNEQELIGVSHLQKFLKKHPLAEVYFITSRAETKGMSVLVQSTQWLEQRGLWPRFNRSTVIPVKRPSDKIQVLEDFNIPFFLDDHAPTISVIQKLSNTKAYVLDELHNQYATFLPRVKNVEEYLQIVERHFE